MATRTAARGPVPAPSTAVIPATLDHETLMALLGQTGMVAKGGDSNFRRMSLISGSLVTDPGTPEEETWPPVKNGPTMTVQIVKPPVYYNAHFLGAEVDDRGNTTNATDANRIGRPDLNGKFCKKYDDPAEQAADQYALGDIYEEISRITGKRGQFRADIQLRIIPESGELAGDEPVYTLSMSTTAAMDWRGTTKNKSGGVVQDKNFIVQLAEFAVAQAVESGATDETQLQKAVLDAMTALRLGGVAADIYLLQAKSETNANQVWTVPAFVPVHLETPENLPAIEAPAAGPEATGDEIPF